MRLSQAEFEGMSHPARRFFHRHVEHRVFLWLGLDVAGKNVLEIGCGNGYGALLLSEQRPASYHGVDLMTEQIELAQRRELPGFSFSAMDATHLDGIESASKDVVVIFGILHHIPAWRDAVAEVRRVVRPGGLFFFEEPDRRVIALWDRCFDWGHHPDAGFRLGELEAAVEEAGLSIEGRRVLPQVLGSYRACRSQ